MGRTFENRRLTMLKRSDRDAKAFSRCGRQIAMAVKAGGPDPDSNPSLRRAVQNARGSNMQKDKIQYAIDKAAGNTDGASFEQIFYEGYGPHGIAMIVDTATDNPTRTVANIRFAFKKESGNLGTSGSVAFMFDQLAVFRLSPDGIEREELELELIDHGLEDMVDGVGEDGIEQLLVRCPRDEFGTMQSALEERGLTVLTSGMEWVPQTQSELESAQLDDVLKLVERLEADDDVQHVFHNLG
jgi:YebC/PmpR family DNA-binding regulatory protein